jgi:hypothetical protein
MAYQYKKLITIDHTKVSADLTSFPVLISITDNDLRTVANGGFVQNANGYDLIFMDSTETTQLDHEIESYTASSGAIVMWVRVPSLSSSVDTVIYAYFGDPTVTTSQENITGVWDSNYKAVYHLHENLGTANSLDDSTSNANDATPYTTWHTVVGDLSATGKISGAQSFDGTSDGIRAPASSSLNIAGYLTISAWVKRATSSSTGVIIHHGVGGVGGYTVAVGVSPATTNQIKATKFGIADLAGGDFPADTNWHYLVESGDSGGTYIYIDGVKTTLANNAAWLADDVALDVGVGDSSGTDMFPVYFAGSLDEIRISDVVRSDGWISTEYANQSNPATFYAIGATTPLVASLTRTITNTAALLLTSTRTIPSTAALLQTGTRTITNTAALLQTSSRAITSTAALWGTLTRTIPSSACLMTTGQRSIPCTAALSAVAPPPTNATFLVRKGEAEFYIR